MRAELPCRGNPAPSAIPLNHWPTMAGAGRSPDAGLANALGRLRTTDPDWQGRIKALGRIRVSGQRAPIWSNCSDASAVLGERAIASQPSPTGSGFIV